MDFPASISEDGRRIAAMVSIETELERLLPQWIYIKDLKRDRIEQEIVLIDGALAIKLSYECEDNLTACMPEAQRRADAANALLTQDRWHPLPCLSVRGSERNERLGPGCEVLMELDIEYKDPRLIISRGGQRIAALYEPTWSPVYRHPECKDGIDTYVESVAFDPEMGIFVISLSFVTRGEGGDCVPPRWNFHPLRLPMFRQKAHGQDQDAGAPNAHPNNDGGAR